MVGGGWFRQMRYKTGISLAYVCVNSVDWEEILRYLTYIGTTRAHSEFVIVPLITYSTDFAYLIVGSSFTSTILLFRCRGCGCVTGTS